MCVDVSLFANNICVVYDAHIPTSLWDFCTHWFIAYVVSQIFVSHTIFSVELLQFFFLLVHKSHKWYLCICAIFNVLLCLLLGVHLWPLSWWNNCFHRTSTISHMYLEIQFDSLTSLNWFLMHLIYVIFWYQWQHMFNRLEMGF